MNTVNVLEIADAATMNITKLVSFPDTEEGNKQAEELFINVAKENGMTDVHKLDALEDGYFEGNGGYWLLLVHSTE